MLKRRKNPPPTLAAVMREMWTDDVIETQARHARLLDNGHPGPPWCFYRAQGDAYCFVQVDVDVDLSGTPAGVIAALNKDIAGALNTLKAMRLSTSEALEAGERRRLGLRSG